MNALTWLLRFIILGVVVGSLVAIGFVFFAIVSVVLMVFGSLAWLRQKDVITDPHTGPVPPVEQASEVVVERKVIDAQYEEIGHR